VAHNRAQNYWVIDSKRLVFVRSLKAASTTIARGLERHYGEHRPDVSDELMLELKNEGYFFFTFVRNTWDRLVSCWYQKIKESTEPHILQSFRDCSPKFKVGMSFGSFIKQVCRLPDENTENHIASQPFLLRTSCGLWLPDFIGRVERFDEDWARIAGILDLVPKLSKMNTTKNRKHYSYYYNKELRNLVHYRYKEEISFFGYKYENVKKAD